jgi:glycosyltransferase involved in cell wall biosynthesis
VRLVVLNHYAGSPEHGMEYRPYYLARQWKKGGHSVTIVAATESHLRSKRVDARGSVTEELIDGIRYVWLRTPSYNGNGVRRALNMAAYVAQCIRHAREILRGERVDFVVASSTYPLDILAARRLASLSGAKVVFEVHDVWPLTPMELGGMRPRHPFIVVMQAAENLAYRTADKVISLLPNTLGHMIEHGLDREKFLYVPNGVDLEAWQESTAPVPAEHANLFQLLRQKGHLIIGYAGSHGLANSLETVIRAASLLRGRPVTFVLVGQGPDRERLIEEANAAGLDNVEFLPTVPRAAVPQLLAHFDAGYLGWRRQPLYRFGISPNKLIDYMMAGLPVVHSVDAANDPVAQAGCGYSIAPEDPESLARAVNGLMESSKEERIAMGERGRQYVLANQTYEVLAERFLDGLRTVRSSR